MTIVTRDAHNLLFRIGKGEKVIRTKGEQQFHFENGTLVNVDASEELLAVKKAIVEKHGYGQERLVESLY
jgi:hypothetical protein